MAGVKETIFKKYGIDIDAEKDIIVKKYKFTDGSISDAEVEKLIQDAKNKWQKTVDSGTMEKQIEDAKVRLAESPKYEKLFRDKKLRVELGKYYNKSNDNEDLVFAKEYFTIIDSTKKIRKDDVDFYIKCFPEERKKKKAIMEMLSDTYKIKFNDKDKNDNVEEVENNKKKEKEQSESIIVNLFSTDTVSQIIALDKKYKECQANEKIQNRYPDLTEDISTFLKIGKFQTCKEYAEYISKCKKEAFSVKQDFGNEYGLVVDVYNIMDELTNPKKHKDINDSFDQFKVLLYYPNLTPYMYPLESAKKKTLDLLFKAAKDSQHYNFKNVDDFINNYYVLVYENFNIDDAMISSMLKKAKKNAEKVLKNIEKAKKEQVGKKGSVLFNILYGLAFWPLYILFAIYEIIKFIVWHLKKVSFAAIIPLFILNVNSINAEGKYSFDMLKRIFTGENRNAIFEVLLNIDYAKPGFQTFMLSLSSILLILLRYFALPIFITYITVSTSSKLKKRFDWIGVEKTLKRMLSGNRERMLNTESISHDLYVKKSISNAIINIIYTVILVVLITVLGLIISTALSESWFANLSFKNKEQVEEVVEETVELTEEELWQQELVAMPEFKGHHYNVYMMDEKYTWDEAEAFCEEKGGHLVSITSEAEQQFIEGLLGEQENYYWIGAHLDDNGIWRWITNEFFIYNNWNDGEPNYLSEETTVMLWPKKWNNIAPSLSEKANGFIFEYEEDNTADVTWLRVKSTDAPPVRTGPAKKYDKLCDTAMDDYLLGTGNTELSPAGNMWYEVYIDNFHEETAYVYSKEVETVTR